MGGSQFSKLPTTGSAGLPAGFVSIPFGRVSVFKDATVEQTVFGSFSVYRRFNDVQFAISALTPLFFRSIPSQFPEFSKFVDASIDMSNLRSSADIQMVRRSLSTYGGGYSSGVIAIIYMLANARSIAKAISDVLDEIINSGIADLIVALGGGLIRLEATSEMLPDGRVRWQIRLVDAGGSIDDTASHISYSVYVAKRASIDDVQQFSDSPLFFSTVVPASASRDAYAKMVQFEVGKYGDIQECAQLIANIISIGWDVVRSASRIRAAGAEWTVPYRIVPHYMFRFYDLVVQGHDKSCRKAAYEMSTGAYNKGSPLSYNSAISSLPHMLGYVIANKGGYGLPPAGELEFVIVPFDGYMSELLDARRDEIPGEDGELLTYRPFWEKASPRPEVLRSVLGQYGFRVKGDSPGLAVIPWLYRPPRHLTKTVELVTDPVYWYVPAG